MKVALIASYEALINGINKSSTYLKQLAAYNWYQSDHDALVLKLGAVRSAEDALFDSTHVLSEKIKDAETALGILNGKLSALGGAGPGPAVPSSESSFRYSTSLSSSSALSWRYPSGSVWVTSYSSCSVPEYSTMGGVLSAQRIVKARRGTAPSKPAIKKATKAGKAK